MRFNRSRERRRYINEIDVFIDSEIKHARRLVEKFRNRDHRDRRFVESAERYVAALAKASARATARKEEEDKRGTHEEFLEHFPEILRDLTTALFQRIESEPARAFALYTHRSSFAPSEVSLEYAVTIRAAEAMNEFYHDRVAGFYPPTSNAKPPLVNLSGGTVAMLRQRAPFALRIADDFPDPLAIERALAVVQMVLDLSCITLPRWSSQHIRTYALAAHEHLHRVLSAAQFVTTWIRARYLPEHRVADRARLFDVDWRSKETSIREPARDYFMEESRRCESAFGSPLTALAGFAYDFSQRLWRFYCDRRVRGTNTDKIEPLRTIAFSHAQEILADIGALVVAGPAFALAFRTVYPPRLTREALDWLFGIQENVVWEAEPQHPPTLLRVRLHIDTLSKLGFEDIPALLERDSRADWKKASALHDSFLVAYLAFLTSSATTDCLASIIELVGEIAGAEHSYHLKHRRLSGSPHLSEASLLDWWKAITRQIEDEGRILPGDVSGIAPPDAINAIWWKRALEGAREPKSRLAWRVALRNYRG